MVQHFSSSLFNILQVYCSIFYQFLVQHFTSSWLNLRKFMVQPKYQKVEQGFIILCLQMLQYQKLVQSNKYFWNPFSNESKTGQWGAHNTIARIFFPLSWLFYHRWYDVFSGDLETTSSSVKKQLKKIKHKMIKQMLIYKKQNKERKKNFSFQSMNF